MHELLLKVAVMLLKSDFLAKVFVLRYMGNELVPSPLLTFPPFTTIAVCFLIGFCTLVALIASNMDQDQTASLGAV